MKYALLFVLGGVLTLPAFSQQNTVSTGGDASGSGGSVSFTVGQIDYTNASGSDGSSNEGVQQPFEFYDPDAALQGLGFNASLYPNPTAESVILKFDQVPEDMSFQLLDAQGKLVSSGVILTSETLLDMHSQATGVYHLQLLQPNSPTTSIKIVKN